MNIKYNDLDEDDKAFIEAGWRLCFWATARRELHDFFMVVLKEDGETADSVRGYRVDLASQSEGINMVLEE